MKRNPKILLTLNIFDTLYKMCEYRKHVNVTYRYFIYMNISNEPQVTICTVFAVNFVFLSVTYVGISFYLKIGGNNTQM